MEMGPYLRTIYPWVRQVRESAKVLHATSLCPLSADRREELASCGYDDRQSKVLARRRTLAKSFPFLVVPCSNCVEIVTVGISLKGFKRPPAREKPSEPFLLFYFTSSAHCKYALSLQIKFTAFLEAKWLPRPSNWPPAMRCLL